MFKQSPRRNQRNKGIKVKHVLQISLLLGVGIWLLYQVQQSRTKKLSLETTDVSGKIQDVADNIKLGRKHLQPKIDGEDERPKEDQSEEQEQFDDENKPDDSWQEKEKPAGESESEVDGNDGAGDSRSDGEEKEVKGGEENENGEGDVKENGDSAENGSVSNEEKDNGGNEGDIKEFTSEKKLERMKAH
ncbi:uncharacterized protein DDB_G0290685-like [Salvia splendens]|uniref:uncharacterized protein DDB_G0290685-like n=1 Tax=Salvia splendens TaxID=180675 RepID=UPI001C272518|nr:uncharacterized protein DDB_G0290685-like [Salvia splendens]